MDKFDKKTRSRIMASIHSSNTSPEILVYRELRKRGMYFQCYYKNALGTSDIAIPSNKKAIFIEGDFWHGFRYPLWKARLHDKCWRKKIEKNRKRDKSYHQILRSKGWKIMRVWEHQIIKDFPKAIKKITSFIEK